MPSKKVPRHLIPHLRGSIDVFVTNPVILIPFLSIAFFQLLALEILYFAPRFPLAVFFNPIVQTLWGEQFVHYPNNFMILPKLFQNVQVFIYIFISSYFISVAMAIISEINSHRKISFPLACRETFKQYIHIFAVISFLMFFGLFKLYNLLMDRALKISSVDGVFFMIKKVILYGAPYVNLIIGTFVAAIFAFVFPIIVIEKKKIFTAIRLNFKHLWGSFWFIFFVVLIPTLFYLPVLLLRSNIGGLAQVGFPEIRFIVLMVSVLVAMIIDATIYTAVTSFYLLKKEHA